MPEVQKALTHTYFDSAASPYLYSPVIYQRVASLVGAEKILFGTDNPLLSAQRSLKDILSIDLPSETKNLILWENAKRLLKI